jgi:hypothetical protein
MVRKRKGGELRLREVRTDRTGACKQQKQQWDQAFAHLNDLLRHPRALPGKRKM